MPKATKRTLADAVAAYGAAVKAKLRNPAIGGAPEDQLRAPLEALVGELAGLADLQPVLVGETTLSHLKTRPDYAVTINDALVGFIEVKAPGKGADPRRFSDSHDKDQWTKLKTLPNIIYTDGTGFSLWRDGDIAGKVIYFEGDLETAGAELSAPPALFALFADFLSWSPIPPRSARELAHVTARLCRLLRNEVEEQISLGSPGLTALAADWRKLLFPEASDAKFADGYAQAVTFGLLIARSRDIELADGVHEAARELRKTNSLIGAALGLLTDDEENQNALKTSLSTLSRVLDAVDWHAISRDRTDAWLYFYEDFLEVYDNKLRKLTGSYYTPPEVVSAMVRLVDEALRGPLFERAAGLASKDVTLADPAMGTGTFLLGVFRRIADTVANDEGPGSTSAAIKAAAKRVIGFELQFGPFAVAQLRLIAELRDLIGKASTAPELRVYVTDTLGNPFVEEEVLLQAGPIAQSRRDANAVKRKERITVVVGNPPYKVDAAGLGGWIEEGSEGRPSPLDLWTPPPEWGVGQSAKHLKNLYVYFWRWATWKVFGAGREATTGEKGASQAGLICFISASGFLNGPGFQKMREDLRREASEIWVVNCSPEGHQPEVNTRIFQGVQQEICIVLAARTADKDATQPARVRFIALPEGRREAKFEELAKLRLDAPEWRGGPTGWRDPFLPEYSEQWSSFVPLPSLFRWYSPGVKTHRTWVIAPDAQSLAQRWERLRDERDPKRKDALFHPDRDRTLSRVVTVPLGSHTTRPSSVQDDRDGVVEPVRYAFRSFDRQWIIPDHRLISQGRSKLWDGYSLRQVYLTALDAHSPSAGPALSFASEIPDNDHFKGSFGGRSYPLWADRGATQSNVSIGLLTYLATIYGRPVGAEDVMAYVAAVMAHPAFTARFETDLVRPGLRVPLTASAALFDEAVTLGREVIWLHTYGERFTDAGAKRPKGAPRLAKADAPFIPADGAIPFAPEPLPDTMEYDAAERRLKIGGGYVDNVTPAMWSYEVSGKRIVWQWFSYRRRGRSKPIIGDRRAPSPLDAVQPEGWLAEYTSDLLDLLNVLGRLVLLEPKQADLLERIVASETITAETLQRAGIVRDQGAGPESDKERG